MTVTINHQSHHLRDVGRPATWAGPAPVCPRCGTLFTKAGDDYHVYFARWGVFEFACGVCDKTFPVTEE